MICLQMVNEKRWAYELFESAAIFKDCFRALDSLKGAPIN